MLYLVWAMFWGLIFWVCVASAAVLLSVVLLFEFWFAVWCLYLCIAVLRIDCCCVGFVLLVCGDLLADLQVGFAGGFL